MISSPVFVTPTSLTMAFRRKNNGSSPSQSKEKIVSGSAAASRDISRQTSGTSMSSVSSKDSPDSGRRESAVSSQNTSATSLQSLGNGAPGRPGRSNSACVPAIPVPVNRPEMELICPLSPTSTSMKAARRPVVGPEMVRVRVRARVCICLGVCHKIQTFYIHTFSMA